MDRSKFKRKIPASKLLSKIAESMASETSGGNTYLEISQGNNYFRVLPNGDELLFYVKKCVHWMDFPKDDGSSDTRRGTVFNGEVHGGLSQDPIEAYIAYVKKRVEMMDDEDEKSRILGILSKHTTSPTRSTTFVCYAAKITDYNKDSMSFKFGELELKKTVKKRLEEILSASLEEEDQEIIIDPFTDIDEGLVIKIKYDSAAKTATDYYKTYTANALAMPDEMLEKLEEVKPLSERYGQAVYTMSDFTLALQGIDTYDSIHDINLSSEKGWLETAKKLKKELEALLQERGELSGEEETEKPNKKSETKNPDPKKSKPKPAPVDDEEEDDEDEDDEDEDDEVENAGDEFDEMDRGKLKVYIKSKLGGAIVVKTSMTDDQIRDAIRAHTDSDEEDDEEEEDETPPVKPFKPSIEDIKKRIRASQGK